MPFEDEPFNGDAAMKNIFLALREVVDTVIETGTYKGVTTKWFAENFKNVITVEVAEKYYKEAVVNLRQHTNVTPILGDSVEVLRQLLIGNYPLVNTDKFALFLDAHWYKNPLLGELKVIADAKRKPVIIIHDFYNPNHPEYGYDTYPAEGIAYNWQYVEKAIEEIYGKDNFTVSYNDNATGAKRGAVILAPK